MEYREMDLNEYQREAVKTAVFPQEVINRPGGPGVDIGVLYCAMKLCGEAGEFAEKIAKLYIRGDYDDEPGDTIKAAIHASVQELGDVLWYVANAADRSGYTLEEIAHMNLIKLRDRQERGVLKGSGDTR